MLALKKTPVNINFKHCFIKSNKETINRSLMVKGVKMERLSLKMERMSMKMERQSKKMNQLVLI